MGSCTRRHFLLSICFLQLITIIERQVFDFLGYMWAPILANFFNIIFVIFGFYGAYHFRGRYIVTYLIWNFIWIGWNSFLICFYLDVGILDKNSDMLNLGTGSVSWFEVNGYGCKPTYPTNITSDDPYRPVRPERVDDCLLDYPIVEIIHSGVQCILAVFAVIGSTLLGYIFLDDDDRFDFMGGDAKSPQHTAVHPMYVSYTSIPTSASATILSNNNHNNNFINNKLKQSLSNNSNSNHNTIISNQYYDDSTATADRIYAKNNRNDSNIMKSSMKSSSSQSIASLHSNSIYRQNSNSNRNKNCSYSNFINSNGPRPDIKYMQISSEQVFMNGNFDESNEEDFNLETLKTVNNDSDSTYVPFQHPVPTNLPIPSLPMTFSPHAAHTTTPTGTNSSSMNNNYYQEIVNPVRDNSQCILNRYNIGCENYGYSVPVNAIPGGPFYQRSGHPPYPDLSPTVTEKYSMPHQYVPRSPLPSRISARRRQDRSHVANFCDQIRNAPPGYDEIVSVSRARSHDRLASINRSGGGSRRSNRGQHKPRPRSYCNSIPPTTFENDPILKNGSKKSKHRQSLYSIEFGPSMDTIRSRTDTMFDYDDPVDDRTGQISPKPMTPRRVKRRSVMGRGSTNRQSTTSRRSHSTGTSNRNSMRSSRRKYQNQNPVTKLMEQQQQQQQQQIKPFASFQHKDNPSLTASNLQSLNNEIIAKTTSKTIPYNSFTQNISPDPIYYNTSGSTLQLQQAWTTTSHSPTTTGGHYNPTYQHSTPNLANENEHVDELYNNRPPSVRSSYSNFHGTRPLSSYNPPAAAAENVFAGLTHQQQQQQYHHHHMPPVHDPDPYPPPLPPPVASSAAVSQPQNIPISRRTASRESIRSMAFLNSGPPAYNLNYHTPPDSETTM